MADKIVAGKSARCPHCGVVVQFQSPYVGSPTGSLTDEKARKCFVVSTVRCPNPSCERPTIVFEEYDTYRAVTGKTGLTLRGTRLLWPFSSARPPIPSEVPAAIRKDYEEGAAVLPMSEEASAALSRRCLQALLGEAGGTKSKDLLHQIEEVLTKLPGYLQKQLDAVRNIGNFAAHPAKSKATGEIIEVEPGEAEWNLDVLDLLFDFFYVQPRLAQQKRDALNKKLAEAGKPPMK